MEKYTKLIDGKGVWFKDQPAKSGSLFWTEVFEDDGKKYAITVFDNSSSRKENPNRPHFRLNVSRINE